MKHSRGLSLTGDAELPDVPTHEMTSAAARAGEHHRVQLRGLQGEEDSDDAVGEAEEEGSRLCECGKTLLRTPAAAPAATATATSKHGRRRRRKKPPDGGERRSHFSDTSDVVNAANAHTVPEIRVIGEKDAGEKEEEEEEGSRRESSGTNSTGGGAVDEGIYDGNSSSIDSSMFGNKSSSNSSSRKSSRDVTNSSREKTGGRRPSYLPTGDAISLLIIEGCELCQEKIRREEEEENVGGKIAGSATETTIAGTAAVSNSSKSGGHNQKKKKQDNTMVTLSQHDPDNWMFCPTTISTVPPPPNPSSSSSSSTSPLRRNVPTDHPLTSKESSSSRSLPPQPPDLPAKKPSKILRRLSPPVAPPLPSLPHHEPEPHGGARPKLSQKIIYEKSSEGAVGDPERFRSRYVRKKKKPSSSFSSSSSSSSSSGSASASSLSSSSSSFPPTPPRAARSDEEGEFQLLPKQPKTTTRRSPDLTCPAAAAAYPDLRSLTHSPPAPHVPPNPNTVSILPQYIQNIIYHSQHAPPKPQHDAKLLKKLSKSILLPEDPSDPTAFTVTPGLTRPPKAPWCSSKPVLKIVGTFAVLMSLGIIIAIVYVNCFSDTFRPMHM